MKEEKELEKFVKWVIKSGNYSLLNNENGFNDGFMFYKRMMKYHKMPIEQAEKEWDKERIEKKDLEKKLSEIIKNADNLGINPKKVPVKWIKDNFTEREWEIYYLLRTGL